MRITLLRQTLFLFTLLVAFSFIQAQTQIAPSSITPNDLEMCRKVATEYCSFWKSVQYDSMFTRLHPEGMGKMIKANFVAQFEQNAESGNALQTFSIKQAITDTDKIIVKIDMFFVKELKPILINGMYSFHFGKDNNTWNIETIITPSAPPTGEGVLGGGHPGD